jgi:hypothetical protein
MELGTDSSVMDLTVSKSNFEIFGVYKQFL